MYMVLFSIATPLPDLFSPSISISSCDTNDDHDDPIKSSSCSDHSDGDIVAKILNQSSSNSDNDDNSCPPNMEIELVASNTIRLNKGEKLVINFCLDSRTMHVTNVTKQLVIPQVKQNKQNRIRRDCPIKGCTAVHLVKLSNHLRQKHGLKDHNKIKKYLKQAKLVRATIMGV